ncbi:fumarylacetoacetate hydrolase family protein [Halobacillus litoralis]|nr:fumarylacetoacetate hydrolase family protein [Halobacillus litoralis]
MNSYVRARVNGLPYDQHLSASFVEEGIQVDEQSVDSWSPPVQGTVYGTLLNDREALKAMENELDNPPYKKPPEAPVLYIKPINTFSSHKADIVLPDGEDQVQIGASVGLVIGKKATNIPIENVYDYIEGYTIVNDVSIPHKSIFRPAIKEKSRDGFCPMGPWVVPKRNIADPGQLELNLYINQEFKQRFSTRNLVRSIPELLSDVTEFMTLQEGDLLMVGCGARLPTVKEGETIRVECAELGVLENTVRRVGL